MRNGFNATEVKCSHLKENWRSKIRFEFFQSSFQKLLPWDFGGHDNPFPAA